MFICDISVFNRYGKRLLDKMLEKLKINWHILVCILVIDQVPGISQNKLIPFLQTDKANVSKILSNIEENGYIARRSNKIDNRNKECYLTPKSKQLVPKLSQILSSWEAKIFENVSSDELKIFKKVNTLITQTLIPNWDSLRD